MFMPRRPFASAVGRYLFAQRTTLAKIAALALVVEGVRWLMTIVPAAALVPAERSTLSGYVLIAMGSSLGLIAIVAQIFREKWSYRVDCSVEQSLLSEWFNRVSALPQRQLISWRNSGLFQSIETSNRVREFVGQRLLSLTCQGVMFITSTAVLGALWFPWGILWTLGTTAAVMAACGSAAKGGARLSLRVRRTRQLLLGRLTELVKGILTVRSLGADDYAVARLQQTILRDIELQRSSASAKGLVQLVVAAGFAALVVSLSIELMAGDEGAPSRALAFAVLQAGIAMTVAQSALSLAWVEFTALGPAVDQLNRLYSTSIQERTSPSNTRAGIVVSDVSFKYPGSRHWIIENAVLHVPSGAVIRVTGTSGLGKTTFLKLIVGMLEPTQGTITIAGNCPATSRCSLAFLPQDAVLYGASLYDNLRLLSGQEDIARIVTAAESTGLAQWIQTLPLGYHTPLKGSGFSISGGERQLVALTALLGSDAEVLVLDEPFGNLDEPTIDRVFAALQSSGKTTLYTSHVSTRLTSSVVTVPLATVGNLGGRVRP
jgi:ABC-type bacteriocin/lantibiotic exporter with double-glycine peptidase domain